MMKMSEAFPSKWLKEADLQGESRNLVMDGCEMEDPGDGVKPVLYFRGKTKGLMLNKINATTIADIHGDESGNWVGQPIQLFPAMTEYKGKPKACIRVRAVPAAADPVTPTPPPVASPLAPPTDALPELDDSGIPF